MAISLYPDVILMDIEMPELDGLAASRLIQKKCPTPIVILTGHESQDLLKKASKVGAGAYLMKPPKSTDIDRAITIAMARHHDLMKMHRLNRKLKESETNLQNIFNTVIPICITNIDYQVLLSNDAYKNIFDKNEQSKIPSRCYESRPGPSCQTDACPMKRILSGENEVYCESIKICDDGSNQYFIVMARPFFNHKGQLNGIVESFQDITDRKNIEMERDKLLEELQKALSKVNLLSGFLPICASCKKIRDDKGYWNQIESYIRDHSEAEFSHGICPDCAKKLYPELKLFEKND